MILKNYDIKKIDINKNNIILFYGQNEGFKNESINILFQSSDDLLIYEEKEILDKTEDFLENLFSKSLFETSKKIIIRRATDKILKIIEEVNSKDNEDLKIVLNSGNLEKK